MIKGWTIGGAFLLLGLLFALEKVHAFTIISNVGRPANWPGGIVHYDFFDIPVEHQKALHDSFAVWTEVGGVDLTITFDGHSNHPAKPRDGRNTVSWIESGWKNLSFRPPAFALAVTLSSFRGSTGEIIDSLIYFNADNFAWGDATKEAGVVDVHNIGTHEVGHLLGLDHSSASMLETDPDLLEATMYYASSIGETSRRIPAYDDELGIRSLYPDNSSIMPPAKVYSVEEIGSSGNVVTLRVIGENFNERTSFVLTGYISSVSDVVSRYRTIISSTEAEVRLNLTSFSQEHAHLIAFNDVTQLYSFSVHAGGFEAFNTNLLASSSGGGGCQLALRGSASASILTFFLFSLLLAAARKKIRLI